MGTYVALFRGINVGGKNVIPMAELVQILEDLGCANVRTYIQSGNAVFDADDVDVDAIARAIEERRGFAPTLMVVDREAFRRAVASNPYPQADEEPKTVHLYFLSGRPATDASGTLEELRQGEEEFSLTDEVLYVFAPAGIARSKLVAKVERALGVPATGRNWRTVRRLHAMLSE